MTKTQDSFCCILLAAMFGCGSAAAPPLKAGTGIKVDAATETISIDDAVVPTGANCASGQVVQRTATGWTCTAAAPDATQLGGKPASAYLTADGTVANATNLNGHAAAYFLPATAKAADSALLNGHTDADFLGVAATAANASALNGHPDNFFLAATATAADSAKLNGQSAKFYLPATATAADSAKLNGQPASFYLPATSAAVDSSKLGGVNAASYARADVPATMTGALTITIPSGSLVLGATGSSGAGLGNGLFGSNGSGNLHVDADSTKVDGHIYLNWFDGNGVRFGNGAQANVAEMDASGNLTCQGKITASGNVSAASFNNLQIVSTQLVVPFPESCKDKCLAGVDVGGGTIKSGTCLSAKGMAASNGAISILQCTDQQVNPNTLFCYCAIF